MGVNSKAPHRKINVGILCGGKSAEHEVSLQSAKNVIEAIDREKYNPILIAIDKTGKWFLRDSANFLLYANDPKRICLSEDNSSPAYIENLKAEEKIDVIFPILHGPFGEDGTVQGLLKLANIPFVGSDVLGSAIGMDKDVMKRLLRDAEIPICDFLVLKSSKPVPNFKIISEKMGLPFFLKPANMGSSIGVYKIHDEKEYLEGLKNAFLYDNKVIIEEFVKGRELECAVLGNDDPIVSIIGEITSSHDFYSYYAKYIDENGAVLTIPANIPVETAKRIQELAIKTFQTLEAKGLSRVDFFLKEDGTILINEINTMPGFTKISMYPKLWSASGIQYSELIDRLITLALEGKNTCE